MTVLAWESILASSLALRIKLTIHFSAASGSMFNFCDNMLEMFRSSASRCQDDRKMSEWRTRCLCTGGCGSTSRKWKVWRFPWTQSGKRPRISHSPKPVSFFRIFHSFSYYFEKNSRLRTPWASAVRFRNQSSRIMIPGIRWWDLCTRKTLVGWPEYMNKIINVYNETDLDEVLEDVLPALVGDDSGGKISQNVRTCCLHHSENDQNFLKKKYFVRKYENFVENCEKFRVKFRPVWYWGICLAGRGRLWRYVR